MASPAQPGICNTETMHPLLTLSYWTSLLPPPTFDPLFLYLAIAEYGGSLVLSVAAYVMAKKKKDKIFWAKAGPRIGHLLAWYGVLGLLNLWLAYEQVYLWGARFWLLVLLLGALIWIGFIAYYVLKKMPKEKAEYEEKQRIQKYLPKGK